MCWHHPQGAPQPSLTRPQLAPRHLGLCEEHLSGLPALAVAKYGDQATSRVRCLDIYASSATVEPGELSLILLCHDNRDGWVVDFKIERKGEHVLLKVSREITDQATSKAILNTYSYRYEKDGRVLETTGDFYQQISP